jgi:hypothetical protein
VEGSERRAEFALKVARRVRRVFVVASFEVRALLVEESVL